MHVPLGGDILASAPSRPPGKACPLPSPARPRQQPEVHDALCSGCRSPSTRFSRLSLAGTMFRHRTELEAQQTSGWQTELSPDKFSMLPFHPNSIGFGKTPLLEGGGWGDGEGKAQKGEKYTNASEQLQFAGRASKRTTYQQGAWQPPEGARPAEHSAGRDALVHTRASPNPGAVCGAEKPTGRSSHPHRHAVGKQICLSLHPSSHGQPQPGRSMCLRLGTLRPQDVGTRGLGFPTGRGVFDGLSSPSCKRCVLPVL